MQKERSRVTGLADLSDCPQISPIVVNQRLRIKLWFLSTCYPLLGWFVGWPAYSDVPRGQAKRMAIIYNLMAARKFWNSRQNILIYSGHPLVDTGDSLGRALALHRSLLPTAVSSDSRNLVKIPSLRARPHLWKQTQGFWGRGWGIRLKPQMVEAQRKLRPSVSWDNIWGGWAALQRRNIVAQHKQQAQAQSGTSTEQHKQSSTSLALEVCHRETDNCICLACPCWTLLVQPTFLRYFAHRSPLLKCLCLLSLSRLQKYWLHSTFIPASDSSERLGGWTGPHLWDLGLIPGGECCFFQCVALVAFSTLAGLVSLKFSFLTTNGCINFHWLLLGIVELWTENLGYEKPSLLNLCKIF